MPLRNLHARNKGVDGQGFLRPRYRGFELGFDFSKQVQLLKECIYLVHCDFVMVSLRCVYAHVHFVWLGFHLCFHLWLAWNSLCSSG